MVANWGGSSSVRAAAWAVVFLMVLLTAIPGRCTTNETLEGLMHQVAREEGVDPALLRAVVAAESGFDPYAISPAGAVGLMQLMKPTAIDMGVRNRFDPVQNLRGGARYLRQMIDQFTDLRLALAAYNAGPGAVLAAKPEDTPWDTESWPPPADLPPLAAGSRVIAAADLIRNRRSGQGYDGEATLPSPAFFRILDATLPRPGIPPFDALSAPPRIHLVLMVHRVAGLAPGLYLLPRRAGGVPREALSSAFLWQPVATAPAHLPLVLLQAGDVRELARTVSCGQDIAGEGCFAVGMLGEFDAGLAVGPWGLRRLHGEAGMVGQALYLGAEAEGFQGTGIGCYFDDLFHQTLGLAGTTFQSLYHFTIGRGVPDFRLTTLPPYGHLAGRRPGLGS